MLFDQLKADLVTAMKSGDSLRVSVLRMLLSEINYKKIALQRELVEEDIVSVIAKEAKKRKESIDSYSMAGRVEQADAEKKELEVLQVFLPRMMDEGELRAEIKQKMLEFDVADFATAMRILSPVFKGRADGSLVSKIVRELMSEK